MTRITGGIDTELEGYLFLDSFKLKEHRAYLLIRNSSDAVAVIVKCEHVPFAVHHHKALMDK